MEAMQAMQAMEQQTEADAIKRKADGILTEIRASGEMVCR